jgi:hypothetical protein
LSDTLGAEDEVRRSLAGLIVATAVIVSPVEAGCLKGAAIGAVAGHFAHHHAVLGALTGCVIAHHLAVKAREQKAAQVQKSTPAPTHN